LQSQAGLALAAAKAAGRNAFRRYTLDMGVANARRVALLRHLRGALAARQFVVRYQPQVRLDNGRLHGVEALLRWEHPDLGLVGPDEFVPLLEEAGAIEAVGAWVMEHAARDAQVWAEAGHPLRVAVNVSPRQLTSGTLTGVVEAVLRGTGLAGSCLELEVTESTLTVDPTRVADQLQRVRELGVTVSIDDFGTGYSSLGRLKQFPVDVLKIDKCFTADLLEGSHDAAIITAIVSLARNLGMKVVAEGIERPDVAEVLRSLRCDTGQGFLFGRPMSAAHIAALSRRAPEWR
jgi:EAL domain-containing protein (putative c-di-GMP-specific phosphodiesterase class I)